MVRTLQLMMSVQKLSYPVSVKLVCSRLIRRPYSYLELTGLGFVNGSVKNRGSTRELYNRY